MVPSQAINSYFFIQSANNNNQNVRNLAKKNVLRTFLNCELSLKLPAVKSSAYINTYI